MSSKEGMSAVDTVDTVLSDAISRGASDIHFEPMQDSLRVRFRIDGVLIDQPSIDYVIMSQVLSRLKVLAHIDIAEKRVPQDGKFVVQRQDAAIDLRVSTFPSLYGQKIVVRILDRIRHIINLEKLGFSAEMRATFFQLVTRSTGLFLVTGPTGAGKTTTLYAALMALHSSEKNIVSLEDPVEYNIAGVTQGQINTDIGFTFAKGIRAVLRQDPDILMVGEIRDKETAHVAIEAALTGHFVLSTLHTNDATSAVMRLMDMGIEPFLINASLIGVLAQRLARTICAYCKKQVDPTFDQNAVMQRLGFQLAALYIGTGCAHCGNLGYKGRIGIFELLVLTPELRAHIVKQPVFDSLYAAAIAQGMETLLACAIKKVEAGIITLDELIRTIM